MPFQLFVSGGFRVAGGLVGSGNEVELTIFSGPGERGRRKEGVDERTEESEAVPAQDTDRQGRCNSTRLRAFSLRVY